MPVRTYRARAHSRYPQDPNDQPNWGVEVSEPAVASSVPPEGDNPAAKEDAFYSSLLQDSVFSPADEAHETVDQPISRASSGVISSGTDPEERPGKEKPPKKKKTRRASLNLEAGATEIDAGESPQASTETLEAVSPPSPLTQEQKAFLQTLPQTPSPQEPATSRPRHGVFLSSAHPLRKYKPDDLVAAMQMEIRNNDVEA